MRVRPAIAGVLLLAVVLRVLWPLADPPPQLSWSSGVYSDPAAKTLPARHAVEEGDWSFEASPYLPVFPLANGLAWLTFRAFGPGRLPWQLLSTAAALAGLVAVTLALRRRVGDRAALFAAILGGASFWLGMFSRSPVVENWVAALLAGASYFVMGRRPAERATAGALAATAALFGKYHAIAFWPGLLAFAWLERRRARDLVPIAAGGGAVLLPWLVFVLVPHRLEIVAFVQHVAIDMQGRPSILAAPLDALLDPFHAVRQAWVFHQAPVAGIFGGVFVAWTIASARALQRRVESGTALFAFWCLGVWIYYGLLSYQAPRYYVIAGLGLVAAAAAQLDEWWTKGTDRWRWPSGWRANVVMFVGLYFFGVVVADLVREYLSWVMLWDRTARPLSPSAFFQAVSPISGALSTADQALRWALVPAALAGLLLAIAPRLRRTATFPVRKIALVALVVAVVFEVTRFSGWAQERKFVLRDLRESIPTMIGPDAVLLGSFAPVVTMGSGITALSYFDPTRDEDVMARYGVTHLLLDDRHDPRNFQKIYPDLDSRVTFLQAWSFRARNVLRLRLYRVLAAPGYVPTAFERGVALVQESQWDEALAAFQEHRATGAAESRELLGHEAAVRYRLGDVEAARRLLERALELRPNDPQILDDLGLLAQERGDTAVAADYFRRALRADPHNAEIIRKLRRALGVE